MKILVSETGADRLDCIRRCLSDDEYHVDLLGSIEMDHQLEHPDLRLLIMFEGHEDAVNLQKHRFLQNIPVLMIDPSGSMDCKQFLSRVRSITNKKNSARKIAEISCSGLSFDPVMCTVRCQEREVILANKEALVLEYLMLNHGSLVHKADIEEYVWGERKRTNVLNVHLHALRRKLSFDNDIEYIHTVSRDGFVFTRRKKLLCNFE